MKIPELNRKWWCIVGDEAHKIKNRKAQLSKAVAYLSHKAQHLILLTATPTENTPDEYWHLLHCLNKNDFSNYWRFVGWYCETRNNGFGLELVGAKNQECLKEHLAPYVIRRRASEVVDLPEEVHQTIEVDLPNKFRKHYQQAKEELLIELDEADLTIAGAAAMFIRLRQLAIHPYVIDTSYETKKPLGKYEALLELLSTLPGQVIIYSSFINAVRLADQYLESSAVYTGSEGTYQTLEGFKIGNFQHLCVTVQKSAGLNLGNADYCIFLDRPLSSIHWRQSKDRIKLIGKQKPIGVYTLQAEDTIDRYVNRLVNHKMSTIEDTQIIKKLLAFYKE
jgi:SNF2 family DNA or RNA helicase